MLFRFVVCVLVMVVALSWIGVEVICAVLAWNCGGQHKH